MTDERATQEVEERLARLTVAADSVFLPPVVEFVRQTAHRLGLRGEVAEHLDRAVEQVCTNVIEHAFEPGTKGSYDVHLIRRPGQVVVAVEDRGLPFDYSRLQGDRGRDALHRAFADEVRFMNLGRSGNRVELIKNLPRDDVRDGMPEEEHHRTVGAPEAPGDALLEIRTMRPEESVELSRCVYRSYGYSYDWDYVYYPERIRELQEVGLMRSCVAVTPEGEFVGHLAVRVERPEAPVGEAGQAVVDPRFRGHHLFPRLKTYLAERAREAGMYGLYSEATAVHPFSQKGNLQLGAQETGFLLGYIPATVSYKEIGEKREGRRGSVALFYMRTNEEPGRTVYPPAAYRAQILAVIEHNALRRTAEDEPGEQTPDPSRISVDVRRDHNVAFVRVQAPGDDLGELVRARLRELCLHRVDCIYADLPLSHPATARAGGELEDLGFFFGGIIPEAHRDGGDVLRLQYLNEVETEREDVHTASEFGRGLLDSIFRHRDAARI